MANVIRGEVPFRAAGRDMFVQYGTRELAEAQAALGFRRPNPHQPDIAEEVDEPVEEGGMVKQDAAGVVYRRVRVIVDAAMRQRRMVDAFEACWMRPDPEAALTCFRVGLRPWERRAGTKLSDEQFDAITRALGLARIQLLHMEAVSAGLYLKGEEEEEGGGKGAGAVSVSST